MRTVRMKGKAVVHLSVAAHHSTRTHTYTRDFFYPPPDLLFEISSLPRKKDKSRSFLYVPAAFPLPLFYPPSPFPPFRERGGGGKWD